MKININNNNGSSQNISGFNNILSNIFRFRPCTTKDAVLKTNHSIGIYSSQEPTTFSSMRSPVSRENIISPRNIQPTTPKLSSEILQPQKYMSVPLEKEDLIKDHSIAGAYYWDHPSLNGKPEVILDTCEFSLCADQPIGGDSGGLKIFHNSTGEEFYVKFTETSAHAFSQKGSEQLYNLFYENLNIKPVPENYLCFDNNNLERGIIGIASRINPNLHTLQEMVTFSSSPEHIIQAHEMLEALEVIHRILGNTDVHQMNVMIEIDPVTRQPVRPQVLDLGDTFIFWEKGIPVEKARRPELTDVLYGPYVHIKDRLYTDSEIAPLKAFVALKTDYDAVNNKIQSIVDRYFSGDSVTRRYIACTIQARINSAFSRPRLEEDSEILLEERTAYHYHPLNVYATDSFRYETA